MLGSNCKVHYAGSEAGPPFVISQQIADVRYSLFTVYHYIKNKKPGQSLKVDKDFFIPRILDKTKKHVIMDSGLFTLMFGSEKGRKDRRFLEEWQDKQVRFVLENGLRCTCVEIDCQKILGVEEAWHFRKRMRRLLPNNRQINVFHLEDGSKGLDRLIEFSDYIAVSVPELRIHKSGTYKDDTVRLANYIKHRKPSIDIHLLGCTEQYILERTRFCTSADSTSWSRGVRFGRIGRHHVDDIKSDIAKSIEPEVRRLQTAYGVSTTPKNIKYTTALAINASIDRSRYARWCGSQD